jgi:hypothetical protein
MGTVVGTGMPAGTASSALSEPGEGPTTTPNGLGGVLFGPLGGGPDHLSQDPTSFCDPPLPDLPGAGVEVEIGVVSPEELQLFGHENIVPQGCDD